MLVPAADAIATTAPPDVDAAATTELSAKPGDTATGDDRPLALTVRVVIGPDSGAIFRRRGPRLVIGREAGDIALKDPRVSRHHAMLANRAGRCLLRDLASSNGTYLGELRVGETFLEAGQQLRVGDTVLEVLEIVDEPDPPGRP